MTPAPAQTQEGWPAAPRTAAPPIGPPPPEPDRDERVWVSLRNQVATRLRAMNARHALQAWELRRDRPVAPWAVAFLYAQPLSEGYQLVAATRLVDDDPDLAGPAELLFRLRGLAVERGYGPWQMHTHMDRLVTAPAYYTGVAVSCLGNHELPWAEIGRADLYAADIPGQCFALLREGTVMAVDRRGRPEFNNVLVHSTGSMSYNGLSAHNWYLHHTLERLPPPPDRMLWHQLDALHLQLATQFPFLVPLP